MNAASIVGNPPAPVYVPVLPVQVAAPALTHVHSSGEPASAHSAPALQMTTTYAEFQMDPDTHSMSVTVRDAGSGETVAAWPIGSMNEIAQVQGVAAGILMDHAA